MITSWFAWGYGHCWQLSLISRVVGEAGDGLETLALLGRFQPDLLVLDLTMPGLSGLDVIERVRKSWPGTRIVVLSMHSNEAYVVKPSALARMLTCSRNPWRPT